MRKPQPVLAILATALGACSGGQGSGDGPSSNLPPSAPPVTNSAPTPTPSPPVPIPPGEPLPCSPCTKIAFTSTRDGNPEIYSINVDGTGLTRLTANGADDGQPAWSPDGRRIAFTSSRDFDGNGDPSMESELYVMDADGGNIRRLTNSKSGAWDPTWSPDGTQIAYQSTGDGSANLWVVALDGGSPRRLFSSPGLDMNPAWSPDGSRLALASDWFAYDFVFDIFVINADGSGFSAVTDGNILDHQDYEDPAWSPDGSRIAVTVRSRLDTYDYVTRLGVMSANGSDLAILPPLGGTSIGGQAAGSPTWSPDGTTIAYTSCSGDLCRVSWIKANGSAHGEIVAEGRDPDWQR